MNEHAKTRICTKCNEEKDLETGFFRHSRDSTSFYNTCKKCRNDGKYVKKGRPPNKFQQLPDEVQADIRAMLADKSIKQQTIADKYGIKVYTLRHWKCHYM